MPKTYRQITNDGDINPFQAATYVTKYGYAPADWHAGMMDKYAETPTNCENVTQLGRKIDNFFKFHETELTTLFASLDVPPPTFTTDITETETHSGQDSQHTGGTDTATGGGSGTDYTTTYDSGALKQTGKAETTSNASTTHDTTVTDTHGHVVTRTKTGFTESPWKYFDDYRKAANFSFYDYVLLKVVDAVSIKIY